MANLMSAYCVYACCSIDQYTLENYNLAEECHFKTPGSLTTAKFTPNSQTHVAKFKHMNSFQMLKERNRSDLSFIW